MSAAVPRLAYYITAHGYGHAVRSCDILSALARARPDAEIIVTSDLPREFLVSRLLRGNFRFRAGRFDVGMVQLDSIRVDVDATLREVLDLLAGEEGLRSRERNFLTLEKISAAICDIPAIPLLAARDAGIPAIAVGNFAWDWIYEEFIPRDARWADAIARFRAGYSQSDLLLRLPFAEPMAAFPNRVDLPLLARPGRERRADLAALTGADPGTRWVLLSFSSLDWDDAAVRRAASIPGHSFFTVRPLAWDGSGIHAVDRAAIPYTDVLASCDVVVTKPGYGVLSECAANRKPIVYAERTEFREYPILEAAIRRWFRHAHIPAERLYRGDLADALAAVESSPPPVGQLPSGGDDLAAAHILTRATPK